MGLWVYGFMGLWAGSMEHGAGELRRSDIMIVGSMGLGEWGD